MLCPKGFRCRSRPNRNWPFGRRPRRQRRIQSNYRPEAAGWAAPSLSEDRPPKRAPRRRSPQRRSSRANVSLRSPCHCTARGSAKLHADSRIASTLPSFALFRLAVAARRLVSDGDLAFPIDVLPDRHSSDAGNCLRRNSRWDGAAIDPPRSLLLPSRALTARSDRRQFACMHRAIRFYCGAFRERRRAVGRRRRSRFASPQRRSGP